jgi:hypothetical protein
MSLISLTATLCVAVSLWGCKVNESAFEAKLYACNPSAVDPACGTDTSGNTMSCVPAYQLGGANFCASSCDAKTAAETDSTVCVVNGTETDSAAPGAVLAKCAPSAGAAACTISGLSCLRTDLREDDGVCMTVSPCQTSADCRDPTRATCMSKLLHDTYGDKAEFTSDHLYCLQTGCNATGSSCSPGETCLRKELSQASHPPDICVPNCDSNNNCPPNYFCIPALYSKASPPICIPGLPGFRCKTKLDCLVGDCVESGSNFKYCSTPCSGDDECAKLDSEQETFICSKERGYCVGSRVYIGGLCHADADCRGSEICGYLGSNAKDGNCLLPCASDGSCQTFNNVPSMCLPQSNNHGAPVCVPTLFGNPCLSDANCISGYAGTGGLTCRPTGAAAPNPPGLCSVPCTTDNDCTLNRFTKNGYCNTQASFCMPALKDGSKCTADVQCESKSCNTNSKTCDRSPGW